MDAQTVFIASWEYEKMKLYQTLACGIQLPYLGSTTLIVRYATIELNKSLHHALIRELDILINIYHSCRRAVASTYPQHDFLFDTYEFIRNNATFYSQGRNIGNEGFTLQLGEHLSYINEFGEVASLNLKANEILITPYIVRNIPIAFYLIPKPKVP